MTYSEVKNILMDYIEQAIKLDSYKYQDLFSHSCTKNRYFMDDATLSRYSIKEIQNFSRNILSLFIDLSTRFDLQPRPNSLAEAVEALLEKTNLHTSQSSEIIQNMKALENWATEHVSIQENYSIEDFSADLRASLQLTFMDEHFMIAGEILTNRNIFPPHSRKAAMELLESLENGDDEENSATIGRLGEIITEKIISVIAIEPSKLNYQWYKRLKEKDLAIQRYDELKQHELYSHLFSSP